MFKASPARAGYQKSMLATSSPRAIEIEALARTSAELARAMERREADYPAFVAALSKNLTLWTRFAADAAGEGNALPADLRAGIIRLASFIRTATFRLMRSADAGDASALIEINANVMEGLRKASGGGAA